MCALHRTAHLSGLLAPREMTEVRIHGAADNCSVDLFEFRHLVAEGDQLRGADEGEVERVEEEHQILSAVIRQRNLLETITDYSLAFKVGRWMKDLSSGQQPAGGKAAGGGERRQEAGREHLKMKRMRRKW